MLLSVEILNERLSAWPGVTSVIQWGGHLVYKVEGKMFSIFSFEDDTRINAFSIKVNSPEHWDELCERDGIVKMPHSTGKNWVSVQSIAGVRQQEALEMLQASYDKVRAGLPKKSQALLLAQEKAL